MTLSAGVASRTDARVTSSEVYRRGCLPREVSCSSDSLMTPVASSSTRKRNPGYCVTTTSAPITCCSDCCMTTPRPALRSARLVSAWPALEIGSGSRRVTARKRRTVTCRSRRGRSERSSCRCVTHSASVRTTLRVRTYCVHSSTCETVRQPGRWSNSVSTLTRWQPGLMTLRCSMNLALGLAPRSRSGRRPYRSPGADRADCTIDLNYGQATTLPLNWPTWSGSVMHWRTRYAVTAAMTRTATRNVVARAACSTCLMTLIHRIRRGRQVRRSNDVGWRSRLGAVAHQASGSAATMAGAGPALTLRRRV